MREQSSVLTEAVRLTVLSNIIQLLGEKVVFERNFYFLLYAQILLRIWDIFFYEGSVTLFRMTLGMLKMKV